MNSKEFVYGIRESIIESNLKVFKNLFNHSKIDQIKDPYWVEALNFFNRLNSSEKAVFFLILRQIEVDTISNVFAILDGITTLDGQNGDFRLTINGDDNIINGELQDTFLEMENN